MDKTHERLKRWCSALGITFENSEAEEAFKSKTKRMADAVLLKTPDRVPNTPTFGMFPALDNGFTCEEVFFDRNNAYTAWMKTLLDLKPDVYRLNIRPGSVWEMIDCKQISLPGRGISPCSVLQFNQEEYAKGDEFYDAFLEDSSDFMMRVYLPRICGALKPLMNLPPMRETFS